MWLSDLLGRPVDDSHRHRIGHITDLVARLRPGTNPVILGAIVDLGPRHAFLPEHAITDWQSRPCVSSEAASTLSSTECGGDEVHLSGEILAYRLIEITAVRFISAVDLELAHDGQNLLLVGVTQPAPGPLRRQLQQFSRAASSRHHCAWHEVEPLIGHQRSVLIRAPFARLRSLSPTQIAALLHDADPDEHREIAGHAPTMPPPDTSATRHHTSGGQYRSYPLTNTEIAARLARMPPARATHAVLELPYRQRIPIINMLPTQVRRTVTAMLDRPETVTADQLMTTDYACLPAHLPSAQARRYVQNIASSLNPAALAAIYTHDTDGVLNGVLSLVALMQADPVQPITAIADPHPLWVLPTTALCDITKLMTQHSVHNMAVADEQHHLIGVITRNTLHDQPPLSPPTPRTSSTH